MKKDFKVAAGGVVGGKTHRYMCMFVCVLGWCEWNVCCGNDRSQTHRHTRKAHLWHN